MQADLWPKSAFTACIVGSVVSAWSHLIAENLLQLRLEEST